MDIQVVFEVDSIVRTNEGGIQVFPTDGPAPIGVGINTTGRYVIKKGKHLSGDFIYSRTNAYQDKQGRLHGIGHMTVTLCHKGNDIVLTSTYTIRTVDSNNAFTVDRIVTPITSATVNGKLAQGFMHLKPQNGGRCYRGCITLEPVLRCPPPGPIPCSTPCPPPYPCNPCVLGAPVFPSL